jgi:hypothetical protein
LSDILGQNNWIFNSRSSAHLLVKFKKQEFALELKVKRDNHTIDDGKDQLHRYLDTLGLDRGYLVIFDPADLEWEEKIFFKTIDHKGKKISMVGI